MSHEQFSVEDSIKRVLLGKKCVPIKNEYSWSFLFDGVGITAESLWRVVHQGRIEITSSDDGQLFGFKEPVNAENVLKEIFQGKVVTDVSIDNSTGDVHISMGKDCELNLLVTSGGYECWNFCDPNGKRVIALGGGELAIINQPKDLGSS